MQIFNAVLIFRIGSAEAYKKATEFSNRLKEEDAFRYRRTVLLYALMACRKVNFINKPWFVLELTVNDLSNFLLLER